MEQDQLLETAFAEYENKIDLLTRALQLAYRRDGLAENVSRSHVAATTLHALQSAMSGKALESWLELHEAKPLEKADHQSLTLVAHFLMLYPAERMEVIDYHLGDMGVHDPDDRDKIIKLLVKLVPIHVALSHLILRAGTRTMKPDFEQQELFLTRHRIDSIRNPPEFP